MNTDQTKQPLHLCPSVPHLWRMIVFVLLMLWSVKVEAQPTTQSVGLDSLSDDKLMNELAMRGLGTLLDRAFEVNKVPQREQESRRTILSLQTLANPSARLTNKERQELLRKVSAGIEQALPRMRDPEALLEQARVLTQSGVERDMKTLEYWGENLTVMSQLRPIAQAVGRIYERAAQLAAEQVNALANQINNPNHPAYAKLENADLLQNLATYSARMNDYAIALSLDTQNPQRKQIADAAIDYLQTLDTEDQPVRPKVRLQLAKLNMVKADFTAARKLFEEMARPDFKPAPMIAEAYEARYFQAVTEVLDRKPDAAKKAMADLLAWQKAGLPADKATQDSAAIAAATLEYRITVLQADLTTDTSAKEKYNAAARDVLLKLQSDHPEFRPLISELIIARLPANARMDQLDTLMLDALVRRGVVEVQRPETEKVDKPTIQRAVLAAEELIKRGDADRQTAENAAFVLGYFHQRLGNDVDSINAFLNYVDHHSRAERAPIAMEYAEAGIARATKAGVEDSRLGQATDRFFPLAINPPYNRKVFAYRYARRLQLQNKSREAIQYFQQVPANDPQLLAARFYQMIATKQVLDELKSNDPDRSKLLTEIQKLADQVNQLAASVTEPSAKENATSMIVRTKLLASELARVDQKDAARAIELLKDFEQISRGLPNESALVSEALLIRVQSLMALGQYNEASQTLITLLRTKEGGQGAAIVYSLLLKLDADFDKAEQAGDRAAMKVLAKNRAALSGFLVEWAKNNPDLRIRKFTYRYSVYEADTKHRAADVEDNPAEQKKLYEEAMKLYINLESPENLAAYKQTLSPDQQSSVTYDPAVFRGIAMVQYDLGNYAEAQKRLAILLKDGRLGAPLMDVMQDGELRSVDNNAYWEAVLKLIRSNLKLEADIEAQKTFLKNLYVRWSDRVGGTKWKDEFAKLKQELIPDFNPPKLDE